MSDIQLVNAARMNPKSSIFIIFVALQSFSIQLNDDDDGGWWWLELELELKMEE